ncbi:MAG: glycosyltransferase, partial [bacterium]
LTLSPNLSAQANLKLHKQNTIHPDSLWEKVKDTKIETNKNFVVIISSDNNQNWHKKNLNSVFEQKYDNYRVIYANDTHEIIKQYIKKKNQEHRTTFASNWNDAIDSCSEDEIIILLDEKDWLANDHVLNLLNIIYANPDVWITYGQNQSYPSNLIGNTKQIPEEIIKNNNFRSLDFSCWHLKTFYAGLPKSIKKEDLTFENKISPTIQSNAIMYPLLEMAGVKSKFIPDILYIHNRSDSIHHNNINTNTQIKINHLLKKQNPYSPLKKCPLYKKTNLWKKLEQLKPMTNKTFIIVIASYNNKDWYKKNLDSVFMQKYDNYHVIYIDDFSPDNTGKLVEQYIKEKKQEHKVTLIKNTQRMGAMANFYNAIQLCDKTQVIVQLDGDDWFANDHVLELLNKVYADPNVWLTYGQYEEYPSGKVGICDHVPEDITKTNNFRNYKWVTSALRTFYAGLFQLIKKEDLLYEGEFFTMTHDLAIMFPMLEMAGFNSKFIPDVLYIYNKATPINDHKVNRDLQIKLRDFILGKTRYTRIKNF